jgi:hypothetical protein
MLGVPDERAMRGGCDYSRQCLLQQRPTGVTDHLDQSQRRFPVPVKDRFVFPTLIISIETNWVFGLKLMIAIISYVDTQEKHTATSGPTWRYVVAP